MNARLPAPPVAALTLASDDPRDLELEENALGLAMLGYPLPDWLEESDFWATQHRYVFRLIEELGRDATLMSVAAAAREHGMEAGRKFKPNPVTSVQLAAMVESADHAMRMGWAVEFERLRELRDQRRVLDAMRRAAIGFRHESMTAAEAIASIVALEVGR